MYLNTLLESLFQAVPETDQYDYSDIWGEYPEESIWDEYPEEDDLPSFNTIPSQRINVARYSSSDKNTSDTKDEVTDDFDKSVIS